MASANESGFDVLCMNCARPLPVRLRQAKHSESLACGECGMHIQLRAEHFSQEIHRCESGHSSWRHAL